MLIIGRRLVHVFEGKNQAEAELRGAATRIRENALQDDNLADRIALEASLGVVVARWRDLCWQFMQTTLISHGNFLLAPVAGLTLCAPRYLAGSMSLGEVTQAVRDSSSDAGPIAAGDWLGLSRSGIEVIDADLAAACIALLDRLIGAGHEIVTIIEGEGASPAITRHLEVWLHDNRPGCDAEVHHGGQPLYPYLFGIE
jgi:hypothetical protein